MTLVALASLFLFAFQCESEDEEEYMQKKQLYTEENLAKTLNKVIGDNKGDTIYICASSDSIAGVCAKDLTISEAAPTESGTRVLNNFEIINWKMAPADGVFYIIDYTHFRKLNVRTLYIANSEWLEDNGKKAVASF